MPLFNRMTYFKQFAFVYHINFLAKILFLAFDASIFALANVVYLCYDKLVFLILS